MIRVIVSENQPGDTDRLIEGLTEAADIQVVALTRDGLETAQMIAQLRPDVALVRVQMPGMDGLGACRVSLLASPETACLLVADSPIALEQVREEAMRSGARGLTHLQTDLGDLALQIVELARSLPRRQDSEFRLVTDPARMPVTIAVTGAKGGIGKTTLATNLAVVLQQRYPGEVIALDFVGQYGDINLLLDLQADGNLVQLADYEEIDAAVLRPRLSRHDSGLWVLGGVTGPGSMEAGGQINLPLLANVLGALRSEFRYLVLDVPPLLHPFSRYVFMRSSYLLVITVLRELAALRNTGVLLSSLLGGQMPPERVKLVVNRQDGSDPFTVSDLEQATGHPVSLQIPNAADTALAALNSGVPFVLSKPNAPISRAVHKLADLIAASGAGRGTG